MQSDRAKARVMREPKGCGHNPANNRKDDLYEN